MNASTIKTMILASASALVLCGCGGTTVNTTIGGAVAGLSGGTSVVLVDNGSDPITVQANGSFSFDVQIASNSSYNVTVQTQPEGETCTVSNGSGTVNGDADQITSVSVYCQVTP